MLAKIVDNIKIALAALFSNKTRSFLTMLGITIGVSSVILLMSVGQAFKTFVLKEFSQYGSNLVVVFGKANNEVFEQYSASEVEMFTPLTQTDLDAIRNPFNVPDAMVVAAEIGVTDPVYYEGETYHPVVGGMTANYLDVYNFEVGVGERFSEEHMAGAARVAILGVDVVDEIFDNQYPIGKHLRVGDLTVEVIGVFNEIQSAFAPEANDFIILPITTVQKRLVKEQTVDGDLPVLAISIKGVDATAVDDIVQDVRQTLRETHKLEPSETDDFIVFSQNQLLTILDTITTMLTLFLAVIAGISLVVGGIGIMNIMLVTVIERTHEIGIRKAVGAQRTDIMAQFLVESMTLSLIGGMIGMSIAIAGCWFVTVLVPDFSVVVSSMSVVIAIVISLCVGIFFGIYPANRAANLNPIDALAYE